LSLKEEDGPLSEGERRRLDEISYLVQGDTYLADTMWYLCKKYVADTKTIDHAFISFDIPFNARNGYRHSHRSHLRPFLST